MIKVTHQAARTVIYAARETLPRGSFESALFKAWFRVKAGSPEGAALTSAFPEYGEAMKIYETEGTMGLEKILKNR